MIGTLGYLLWDKFGEEIGLKQPQPVVVQATPNIEATTSLDEQSEPEIEPPPPPPKLISPSIEILNIERDVAQALDPKTSKVLGLRLFIEFKIRNLSPCNITKVEARVQLINGSTKKRPHEQTFEFSRPIEPNGTRFAVASLPVQEVTGADITVFRVWADDQSDSTEVSKGGSFEE